MTESNQIELGDANDELSRRSGPGTPRWVKVLGVIIIGLVLLFGVMHLSGHGPMDHMNMNSAQQGTQMP